MILPIIAPVGQEVLVRMNDGQGYRGYFTSFVEPPFASFKWEGNGFGEITIYINQNHVSAVIPVEDEHIDRVKDVSPREVRNILGKHSAKANGET